MGVAAGAFSGVAAASSDALPGDHLYPVKRGMEDLKLGMADEDADRGELYLDQASNRLSEARRLMERGRTGVLDHESLGAIRRALAGVKHDAEEGHRLLQAAYERDGSLGPIQKLSSFSRSHRDAWGKLRERLPAQLTDVGGEVESVFQAIDDDVAPLQSMLPKAPDHTRGSGSPGSPAKPGTPGGTQQSAPASGTPSGSPTPPPSGSARPAPPDGLLGGTGDLLNPPTGPSAPATPATPDIPKPDITLPPLLPGLLPGLGINAEDAGQ